MQKRKAGRTLSRKKGVREALLVSLARALTEREKIQTTEAKAKEVIPLVDRLITKAKKGDLHARRELQTYLSPSLAKKMVEDIAPRYQQRAGGYARIIKTGLRKSDGARMAIVELVK